MRVILQKLGRIVDHAYEFVFRQMNVWAGAAVYLVGFVYLSYIVGDLSSDTTAVTNGAFVMVASLSALSFSACRSITEAAEDHELFRHSGERFLHAAILLLLASIIKYAAFAMTTGRVHASSPRLVVVVGYIVGALCMGLFTVALYASHSGLTILNHVLWQRFQRSRTLLEKLPFYTVEVPPNSAVQPSAGAPETGLHRSK